MEQQTKMQRGLDSGSSDVIRAIDEIAHEHVTERDVLSALCFKAIEDPKGFSVELVRDMVSTLGFEDLWEAAAEQVLMLSAEAEDEEAPTDPEASEGAFLDDETQGRLQEQIRALDFSSGKSEP